MEGRITRLNGGLYTVKDLDTGNHITCVARGKFRSLRVDKDSSFNKSTTHKTKVEAKNIKLSPKVGDICVYSINDGINTIDEIKERKNDLIRPFICNVDKVILVFASKRPDFQLNLLDQFLVILSQNKVEPEIVISKVDLLEDDELSNLKNTMSYYESIGYPVHYVNSKTGEGFDEIRKLFRDNKMYVLSGQTGAGKSTFINALIPGFELKTDDISEALGRGKHTTRVTELYEYLDGFIGDTPGFSKLDFSLIKEEEIKDYFVEFQNYTCKFRDCLHDKETGCGVKKAVEDGIILKERYENYTKFLSDIKKIVKKY